MQNRSFFSIPTLVSTCALLVIAAVVVASGWSVVSAALVGSVDEESPDDVMQQQLEIAATSLDLYGERINGRSAFYKPAKRPPVVKRDPPPQVNRDPEPREPAPPPGPKDAPASYRGPAVVFVLGQEVWFAPDDKGVHPRYKVGESFDDFTILGIDHPHTVRIEFAKEDYKSKEYAVKVFENWKANAGLEDAPASSKEGTPGIVEVSEKTEDDDESSGGTGDA